MENSSTRTETCPFPKTKPSSSTSTRPIRTATPSPTLLRRRTIAYGVNDESSHSFEIVTRRKLRTTATRQRVSDGFASLNLFSSRMENSSDYRLRRQPTKRTIPEQSFPVSTMRFSRRHLAGVTSLPSDRFPRSVNFPNPADGQPIRVRCNRGNMAVDFRPPLGCKLRQHRPQQCSIRPIYRDS